MQLCPNCQADITGLIHHCDCCGAPIHQKESFFRWHAFMTADCGDLMVYTREIFDKLEQISDKEVRDDLKSVIFDIFCYPPEMCKELKLSPSIRYSRKQQALRLRLIVNYSEYITGDPSAKRSYIVRTIQSGIDTIRHRQPYASPHLEKRLCEAELILHESVSS